MDMLTTVARRRWATTAIRMLVPLLLMVAAQLSGGVAPAAALTFEEARHLAQRTGFGPALAEVKFLMVDPATDRPRSRAEAVDALLDGVNAAPTLPPPDWAVALPGLRPAGQSMSAAERAAERAEVRRRRQELPNWWILEMAATTSPFTEVMTLFWHGHFTSEITKVWLPELMYRQNALFRRHVLGNYRELLRQVSRDPAMAIYLDNNRNSRDNPNENYGRELLELFTLGIGHYGEADVKAAARAFTGWRVNPRTGAFRVVARLHDDGDKSFLGRTGPWGGDDIIDIILEQDRAAVFLVEKLWRHFVSPEPDAATVAALARVLRDGDYELRPLLRALFLTDAFWDQAARGRLIKSPVDLIVGMSRVLLLPVREDSDMANASRQLGQFLFKPPNVKGWPGHEAWITTASLPARHRVIRRALQVWADEVLPATDGVDMGAAVTIEPAQTRRLAELLLPVSPVNPLPSDPVDLASALEQLMYDPAFQLK